MKYPIQILLALESHQEILLDLKINGSDRWWKKQKQNQAHEDDLDSHFSNQGGSMSGQEPGQNNEDDQVGYGYEYPDGGGIHCSGLHMIHGDQSLHNSCTTYYNAACQVRLPIPPGFTAPPYGDPKANLDYWR